MDILVGKKENNMDILNEYLNFLWLQFQHDWSIFSNPWVLYTVIPALIYLAFFVIKWWILLVPITLPLSIIAREDTKVTSKLKKEKK